MDSLSLSIIAPAFIAGALLLLSHIPLGSEVLKRGIIFIDIAIAQIAGLGIILAHQLGLDAHGFGLQVIALCSALFGALLFSMTERLSGRYQEAVIGITFILAATASILLLTHETHGGEHLQSLLIGQILWIDWQALIIPLFIHGSLFLLWLVKPSLFTGKWFYVFFAIAITSSVQLVGVYLVFGSLILPALAVIQSHKKSAFFIAYLLGLMGYGVGLLLSNQFDLPSGAIIVWTLAIFCLSYLGYSVFTRRSAP